MKRPGERGAGMTHDIFISHSSHDLDVAEAACTSLEERGLDCWTAPRNFVAGMAYGEGIAAAIAASRLFLLIFSAETNDSANARREAEQASALGLPILGFRIADLAPVPTLAFLVGEWLDALTPPIAPHLDYLGDRIAQMLGGTGRGPLQPTLPPRPLPPRRRAPRWLPIALAGLAGLAAIAIAAAYVAPGGRP